MNPDTDKNRNYYQRMYNQIHASDKLKERLIHMKTNTEQSPIQMPYSTQTSVSFTDKSTCHKKRRFTWKTAAAAIILAIAVPGGALAASHYIGLAGFFSESGHTLPEDGEKLIETDISQSVPSGTSEELPVTFSVKEALCDSGEINIAIEAKAAESGKYLLVPDWAIEPDIDPVSDILQIQEDKTIAEYASEKGLELMYVNCGFHPDSSFELSSSSYSCKSKQDDTLVMFISANRINTNTTTKADTTLDIVMTYTMLPESDYKAGKDFIKSSASFTLQDKSTLETTVYQADNSSIPETDIRITGVTMSQTEIHTYVDIAYENPSAQLDTDGFGFRIKDSSTGQEWNFSSGSGIEQTGDGTFHTRLSYDRTKLPQECILEIYGTSEKNVYGQITLKRI